jgi:hypothetical protein
MDIQILKDRYLTDRHYLLFVIHHWLSLTLKLATSEGYTPYTTDSPLNPGIGPVTFVEGECVLLCCQSYRCAIQYAA